MDGSTITAISRKLLDRRFGDHQVGTIPQINELFHVQCKFAREWDCGRKRPCLDRFGEEMERVACLCNAADGKTMQYLLPHIPLFLAATQILCDQVLCHQVVVSSCYWRPERRWSNRWMWIQHIKILRVRIEMKWESDVSDRIRLDRTCLAYHIYHVTLLRRGPHPPRAASLMSSTLCSRPPSRSWVEIVQGGMFRQEICVVDYRQVAHNSCILMYEYLILYELSCEHMWTCMS